MVWTYLIRDEEVEIKKVLELKTEGWRKRGRLVKRWTDMVEEDMKKEGSSATRFRG